MSTRLQRIYRGETRIDFIGKRRLWFVLSAVLALGSGVLLLTKGLDFGIEFRGGVSIQAPIEDPALQDAPVPTIESTVRDALAPFGADDAQIQIVSDDDGRSVLVQTEQGDPEVQEQILTAVSGAVGTDVASTDSQRIGSRWGGEITRGAARALVVFILVVFLFISWRFEWKMAVASVLALAHDLLLTAGVYSLVGFEVTPSTVIAILTILGYSLYDTVVVFDKVEENATLLAVSGKMTYQDSANTALNQVFMRSLNTSLSTLLPVAALLFVGAGLLGAETLKDLALALLVGLLMSAYSSIFVATPFLSMLKEREPKYRGTREKLERAEQRRAEPQVAMATAGDGAVTEPAPSTTRTAARPSTPQRPRPGSKKAARRKRR